MKHREHLLFQFMCSMSILANKMFLILSNITTRQHPLSFCRQIIVLIFDKWLVVTS